MAKGTTMKCRVCNASLELTRLADAPKFMSVRAICWGHMEDGPNGLVTPIGYGSEADEAVLDIALTSDKPTLRPAGTCETWFKRF